MEIKYRFFKKINRSQWNCTIINLTKINVFKIVQGKYQMEIWIYIKEQQVPETGDIKISIKHVFSFFYIS